MNGEQQKENEEEREALKTAILLSIYYVPSIAKHFYSSPLIHTKINAYR